MYNYIINPDTGKKYSVHSKTGKRLLSNYLQEGGSAWSTYEKNK